MKKFLAIAVACGAGFGAGYIVIGKQMIARHAADVAAQQSAWAAERAALESALEEARSRPPVAPLAVSATPAKTVASAAKDSPAQIIARLRSTKASPGLGQVPVMRRVIHDLEDLIAAGPAALPAIRDFLGTNEDVEFNASTNSRSYRDVPSDFLAPPSLRFALFEAAKQIGGAEAEKVLAEALNTTGQGIEVAWLVRALQQMTPDKYRDAALLAARALLERNAEAKPGNLDRDQGFRVLAMFNDASYVATAQSQLVRTDGQVDNGALKYLLHTLGPNAVPLAAQLYDDPRITDPQKKEPFVRAALNYVGADATANEFYAKAINDFGLSNEQRKNLIEDLNQDGFVDRKNLTAARDLPLIDNRLQLIIALSQTATDPVNVAALKEAYKDLARMRERIAAQQVR